MSLLRAGLSTARRVRHLGVFSSHARGPGGASHVSGAAASISARRFCAAEPAPPRPAGRAARLAQGQRKSLAALGGFTYPGPRKLSDIVKLPLLNAHAAPRVQEIWAGYHKSHATAIADTLSSEEFGLMMQRTERCPNFVVPIPRKGGYFTMLCQFQGRHCLVTYLEDFKTNPGGAQPFLTLTMFDDFVQKKGLALVRGEVTNQLTRDEATLVLNTLKKVYLGPRKLFDNAVAFNENSSSFDFKAVLNLVGIAA